MADERLNITDEEYRKILGNVFESLDPLRLKVISSKEKKKLAALHRIADDPQHRHEQAHLKNEPSVSISDSPIDNLGHNERNQQFKGGLQHLEQGGQHRLLFIIPQID